MMGMHTCTCIIYWDEADLLLFLMRVLMYIATACVYVPERAAALTGATGLLVFF
jgi:hypothetical protein